jgi:hypothetical protein
VGGGHPFSEFIISKEEGNTKNFYFLKDFLVTLPDLTLKVNCPILGNFEPFALTSFNGELVVKKQR